MPLGYYSHTSRTTIQAITQEELQRDEIQRMLASYDRAIDDKLNATEPNYSDLHLYREDDIEDDDIELELTDQKCCRSGH